jgi:DNA-binding IclR family transcriptional regulator
MHTNKKIQSRKRSPRGNSPRHGNRSILVAVDLLDTLASFGRPASLSEIAAAAKMPAMRVHRHLLGLTRTRLIEQNPATARYDFGPHIIELGVAALGRINAVSLGADALRQVTERTGLASLLCVWGTNGPTVIKWEQGDLSSAIRIREGRNLPLLRTASGRVFLAYLPGREIDPILDRELSIWSKIRPNVPPPDRARIDAIKGEVLREGLALGIGEEGSNFAALAAPVFDINDRVIMSLTIISVIGSFDTTYTGGPATALREVARDFSKRLGAVARTSAEAGLHPDGQPTS